MATRRCKVLRNKSYFVVFPNERNQSSEAAIFLARLAYSKQLKSARLTFREVPVCDMKYGVLQRRKGN